MIIILALTILVLLITLANVLFWPAVRSAPAALLPMVSVLIPARNEEANLPECLRSLSLQGEVIGEILIYDDHSTDGTRSVIEAARNTNSRIALVQQQELEIGWTGKNFACAKLAEAARFPFILFIDADARLQPGAVDSMLQEMRRRRLELLSCWPGLKTETFWERLLMPMLNFVVFSIYPGPLALFFSYQSLALAHGACLMFERQSYLEVGGHRMVHDQIFEDTRLAQLWRQLGRRALCLDGQRVVRVRMYENFSGIWQGFLKNFYPAFQRRYNFWIFLLFHLLVVLGPFFMLAVGGRESILGAGAIIGSRLLLAIRFNQPWTLIFLHPLAEIMMLALGLNSWWRCRSGRGVNWKDRTYHTNELP